MKKFVIMALITMMVAGAAFAQLADGISVNGWGRVMFTPLRVFGAEKAAGEVTKNDEGDDSSAIATAGTGASWGGDRARVDFRINGATDYVGFSVASSSETGNLGSHDNGYHIWVKPTGTDILKITAGAFVDETLRGKIGNLDGGFSNVLVGREVPEEDSIFQRFGYGSESVNAFLSAPNAFMISSVPVEGAFIGIMVSGKRDGGWSDDENGATRALDAYRFMQIGAGYNIDGIGHIRAQWVGGFFGTIKDKVYEDMGKTITHYAKDKYGLPDPDGKTTKISEKFDEGPGEVKVDPDTGEVSFDGKHARIEAAFALTALDNLLVDVGGKFWLPIKPSEDGDLKISKGVDIGLGATFRADAFSIGAKIDATGLGSYIHVDNDDKSSGGLNLRVGLVPTYDLDFATVGASLAMTAIASGKDYEGKKDDKFSALRFGFGGFVSKGLAGGSLKAGLAYTTPYIVSVSDEDGKVDDWSGSYGRGVFQIPVILEYAFF